MLYQSDQRGTKRPSGKSERKKPSNPQLTMSIRPVSWLHAGLTSPSVIIVGPLVPNVIKRNATRRGNHSSDLRQKRSVALMKKPSTTQPSKTRLESTYSGSGRPRATKPVRMRIGKLCIANRDGDGKQEQTHACCC